MITVTIKKNDREYTIVINKDSMILNDIFFDAIVPVLLAVGYADEDINDFFNIE